MWSSTVSVHMIAAGSDSRWRTCASLPTKSWSLTLPQRHVGLDDVVLGVELEAERPVALLDPPGRAVDADPGGDDAVRLARLPERVPQPRALLDRHVQLPAEVADVGDPEREHLQRADLDRAAAREREALVRDVVAVRLARMSRARGPHRPSVVQADVRSVTGAPSSGVVARPT